MPIHARAKAPLCNPPTQLVLSLHHAYAFPQQVSFTASISQLPHICYFNALNAKRVLHKIVSTGCIMCNEQKFCVCCSLCSKTLSRRHRWLIPLKLPLLHQLVNSMINACEQGIYERCRLCIYKQAQFVGSSGGLNSRNLRDVMY
jgi:hypothetical protein